MDKRKARKLLNAERERLVGIREGFRQEHIGEDAGGGEAFGELSVVDQHPADVGTETFELEKDMSILTNVEAEIQDVDRALERLDAGTYGKCEACGRPIDDARLEARPAARYCIEDQARVERAARSA